MDYLMKLVTIALEWSYVAREADVKAETLQSAAELLTLRRDTIRMMVWCHEGLQWSNRSDTIRAVRFCSDASCCLVQCMRASVGLTNRVSCPDPCS